jgi:DNA-binding transcriptional MerR regulator/methylmalonyl-CoA mutase cobalamin-binding subunit
VGNGDKKRKATEARHPIGVVSSRCGLPQDLLRAWERRYAAVTPHRTDTGRRLYSEHDLEKLAVLKLAVESGRRIGDVANLSVEEIQTLIREDKAAGVAPSRSRPEVGDSREPDEYVQTALTAIEGLDGGELDRVLHQATVDLSPPTLRDEVIRPLLERVGERWRAGSLRIANEHFASAVIRSFLGALRLNGHGTPGSGTVVVATPAGQRHELGALLAAKAALEIGWDPVYLGPDLPAAEIAAAARQRGARVVALSIVCPANDPRVTQELRELRSLLGDSTVIIAGGAAAESYDSVIAEIGGRRIEESHIFQSALEAS